MAKYELDDVVTYYFVIVQDGHNARVQGWTDRKELAKAYMEFHKCKDFKLKNMTDTMEEITKILEENTHDEIKIYNLRTKDPEKKKGKVTKRIQVPATETEMMYVREEINSMFSSVIDYSYLNSALPYFKSKYQKLFNKLLIKDAIASALHQRQSVVLQQVEYDELAILYKSFNDKFGI